MTQQPHSPTLPPTTKKQLNKEAKWSFGLTVAYMLGWIVSAYFSPDGFGIFGLPLWFELSCVFLPIIFIVVSSLTLKGIYQDIDFYEQHQGTLNNTQNQDSEHTIGQHTIGQHKDTP